MSVWSGATGKRTSVPSIAEPEAVRLLSGVGGDREWWIHSDAPVGHLRVPLTPEEYAVIPPGCAVGDAGDTGPERPRTRR